MAFPDSIKDMFRPIATQFHPALEFLSRTLSVWLALLGLAAIVIGATNPFGLAPNYVEMFHSIGSAVLVGGVFGVLLKSLQYSNVFKIELCKIIYGENQSPHSKDLVTRFRQELREMIYGAEQSNPSRDVITAVVEAFQGVVYEEKFLQKRKDLKDLWEKISVVVYTTKYPAISEKLARKVTNEYFPTDDTFYYDQFEEDISLKLSPDKKFIETQEVITLCVKPVDSSQPVEWSYFAKLYKSSTDTSDTKFILKKLVINGVDKTNEHPASCKDILDGNALHAHLKIKLEGAPQYNLSLEVTRIYIYELNRQRDMKSQRFINKPVFRVGYDSNELELEFVPVGTNESAYESEGRLPNLMQKRYKDLIFPNQGYTLVLRRR